MRDFHAISRYSSPVLRLGLVFVVIWFGTSQLYNTGQWIGIVPAWAVEISRLDARIIVLMNGWFEIIMGMSLVVGIFTRWAALILAAHLFVIAIGFGLSPIGVRDVGLSIALFSVALAESDWCCFDFRETRNAENIS